MPYYIVTSGKRIVDEFSSEPSQGDLQWLADEIQCELYVIEGDRYGMAAEPDDEEQEDSMMWGERPECMR